MEITLLGIGGPRPDPERHGPALLVSAGGRRLLFDAGRGAAMQLVRAGTGVADLDAIFLTHHHYDHIGGLGDVLMAAWIEGRTRSLPVLGPPGTRRIVGALFDQVYEADIRFRLREAGVFDEVLPHPAEVFPARDVAEGARFDEGGVSVVARRVDHGDVLELAPEEWLAYGYRIEADGARLAVSGDAVACAGLDTLAEGVEVLVMCCYLATEEIDSPATEFLASRILAAAPQVGEIAARSGVRTLVLTHFREKNPALIRSLVDRVAREFPGTVIAGEDLLVVDV